MLVGFSWAYRRARMVISQYFGGRRKEDMSKAVHSSIALTALLSVVFTVAGCFLQSPLRAIGVPEEVLPRLSCI